MYMFEFGSIPAPTMWLLILLFISTLTILTLSMLVAYKSTKCAMETLTDKFKKIPMPMCIIDLYKNKIVDCNTLMSELFNKDNLKNMDVSLSGIFSDFNVYLDMKNQVKHSNPPIQSKIITIPNGGKLSTVIDVSYSQVRIGFKKYMLLLCNDKTSMVNYLKCLGIFSSIIDESPDGIIISKYNGLDSQPTISYVNDSITNITGYSRDELKGKPLSAMFNLNVDEPTLNKINSNIHSLIQTTLEYQYIKKNGEICWVITDIIPITNNNINKSLAKLDHINCIGESLKASDNIEIYITIHQKDITAPKKFEESSRVFIDRLQAMVKDQAKFDMCVIDSLTALLEYTNKDVAIQESLKTIGKCLGVDRAYVFSIYESGSKQYMKYSYEWVNVGVEPEIDNAMMNDVTFEEIEAYELYADLISNKITKIYTENVKSLAARHTLMMQNIKTAIVCPIYKENKLIGFIGFDDCTDSTRIWDVMVERSLRSLSKAIGNVMTYRS